MKWSSSHIILLFVLIFIVAIFAYQLYSINADCHCNDKRTIEQMISGGLSGSTSNNNSILNTSYQKNNYDVQYHDDIGDLTKQDNIYYNSMRNVKVLNEKGEMVFLPYAPAQNTATYYAAGSYKYGAQTYVPSYTDTVYLGILYAGGGDKSQE